LTDTIIEFRALCVKKFLFKRKEREVFLSSKALRKTVNISFRKTSEIFLLFRQNLSDRIVQMSERMRIFLFPF
jgi:hypothetical protein